MLQLKIVQGFNSFSYLKCIVIIKYFYDVTRVTNIQTRFVFNHIISTSTNVISFKSLLEKILMISKHLIHSFVDECSMIIVKYSLLVAKKADTLSTYLYPQKFHDFCTEEQCLFFPGHLYLEKLSNQSRVEFATINLFF